jgi:hypothetical protein
MGMKLIPFLWIIAIIKGEKWSSYGLNSMCEAGILSREDVCSECARHFTLRHLQFPARAMCWLLEAPHKRFSHTLKSLGRSVRFAAHRQPFGWNFLYHSRIVLSIGGSVWFLVRNVRYTITIDSVLANSKTRNAFLSPEPAMFRNDCSLVVKPANTPWHLLPKLEEILYLLICSFLLCLSWLLRCRVQNFQKDIWSTLYIISVILYTTF